MFSWVELAVVLLKITLKVVNWLHDQGKIDEGRRQVLSENALALAARVTDKNKIKEWADGLSEPEVDEELLKLVRPAASSPKRV